MDSRSLSFRQVRWTQELSRYHFQIDYRQGKANGAADALLRFPQRSQDEEEALRAENTQNIYCLQNSLTTASLSSLSLSPSLTPLHQVLISGTHHCTPYPKLRLLWTTLRGKLATAGPYASVV